MIFFTFQIIIINNNFNIINYNEGKGIKKKR